MATDPITPAEIHAAELAALRDEVDQQRTRAEAAEAELREAHKLIATMEATAEIVAKQRSETEAGLRGMRERFDNTHRMLMRAKVAIGMQADRDQVEFAVLKAIQSLTSLAPQVKQ